MKKVLIITRHYLDENNGGSNGSKAYIRALSELFPDCTLIYPEHLDKSSRMFIPPTINAIPCCDYRSKIKKGLDVYCGILHRLPRFVIEHIENNTYDIVVIDHSITANGIIEKVRKSGCKTITIHHNNEYEYIRDNKPSLLYRWPYIYYSEKAERNALLMSDLNLTVTEKDKRSFCDRFPDRNIHSYNMGTFHFQNLPADITDDGIRNCKTFAITGSMNFQQSQKPIVDFVDKYFPLLLHKIPEARLIVAGRNPLKSIWDACERHNQISLIPNPENITEVINKADIYICPINTGSGVKLRVMDGLKLGLPVLGHSVSLNGYEPIQRDGFFFEYHDENSFLKSLDRIAHFHYNKKLVYNSFRSYFDFEAGKKRLEVILRKENII